MLRALLCLCVCILPATALASPWTLRRGQIALTSGYNFQTANREALGRGSSRRFPLRGRYTGNTYFLDLRAGYTDRFEVELLVPFKSVEYTADPVVLLAPASGSFDGYQNSVINLSRSAEGLADLVLAARYRLLLSPLAMALELKLKTPTGYAKPSGTFGSRPRDPAQFLKQLADLAKTDRVEDDVTLGDGQVDLTPSLLLGGSFQTGTFVRADLGYNVRFGGAGDQVVSALKIGQSLTRYVLVYAYGQLAYTVERGSAVGISVVADDPRLPAAEYEGLKNLRLRLRRLERDAIDAGLGAIIRVTDDTEINASYARTTWGGNTALTDSVSLSVAIRSQVL